MLDGFQGLVDLSRLDGDLAVREGEKAKLPSRRESCAERRAAGEARLEAARTTLVESEQLQRKSETEMQDHEALLTKLEGQQHQVKTNEAYTALLAEMDAARAAISDAETGILEAMEQIEQAQEQLAAAQREVDDMVSAIGGEETRIDAREQELDGEIADLRKRREDVTRSLDPVLLRKYERVAGRRSPPVAVVTGEICQGCRVGIPPQAFIEIQRGEDIVSCGNCQRLLIHEDRLRHTSPAS
jgi:predicted  nucleic acid-binding Zn-ribbon protein